MIKLFNDNDFSQIARKRKISIALLILVPFLLVLTLTLCFIFVDRGNQNYLFFIMSAVTVVLVVGEVLSVMFFKFINNFYKLFNQIRKNEFNTVCTNVDYIENDLVTLEKDIQVKQVHITINEEPFIAYFLNNYDFNLVENKNYKFVLSGNFIVEYEEYEN